MKIAFSILMLLLHFSVLGQEHPNAKLVKDIVSLTVDQDFIVAMRALTSTDLMEIEKERFLRDYDSISNDFLANFEKHYVRQYSEVELLELDKFYNTSVGKKMSADLRKFLNNNLPQEESLNFRLKLILAERKTEPEPFQDAVNDESTALGSAYLSFLGSNDHLEVVKNYNAMWLEPQYEKDFKMKFDLMVKDYLITVREHYDYNYSDAEKLTLEAFFDSPLGKKVINAAGAFARLSHSAKNIWFENFESLHHNLSFGKYQRN
jgi:hypothetical protein